jgi:DNA-binding MarR family transcriptional regulator
MKPSHPETTTTMNDMSRKSGGQLPDDAWLTDEQQRTWQAWMRVMLRLQYEMNRQLQDDAGLTLADYDVLVALSNAPGARLQLSDLAATIGWERSRLSHHLLRMGKRGLVDRLPSENDGRATDAVLTSAGRQAITQAASGHVARVRELFFGGLQPRALPLLTDALEQIYDHLLTHGILPPPPHGSTRQR